MLHRVKQTHPKPECTPLILSTRVHPGPLALLLPPGPARRPQATTSTHQGRMLPQLVCPWALSRVSSAASQAVPLLGAAQTLPTLSTPHSCTQLPAASSHRPLSDGNIDGRIGADPDEVADLLESNIYRPTKAEREQQRQQAPSRLLTTRREALSLYREVLRYSNLFVWKDEHGRVWRDVIRSSARQEFEAARFEPDPELINRMIVTGRDAVQRTVEGFMKKRARIIDDEASRPQVPPL